MDALTTLILAIPGTAIGIACIRAFHYPLPGIGVPLTSWKGILVGSLFSFMTSIQEASATLFLTLGGWEMITVGIFTFYIAGSQNEAAALGFILIVVAALSLLVINRVAGTRMGGMFG